MNNENVIAGVRDFASDIYHGLLFIQENKTNILVVNLFRQVACGLLDGSALKLDAS